MNISLRLYIYWAKVLADHTKNCDYVFGLNFETFNENTIWYQSCASAGTWHSACRLCMRIHIKHLKYTCNSRNNFNRNSNHKNLNNSVFSPVKMALYWLTSIKTCGGKRLEIGGWQCSRRRSWHSVKLTIVSRLLQSQLTENDTLRFQMIIYRFLVIQASKDHSLSFFMLLEPYGISSPPYIESKWNLH